MKVRLIVDVELDPDAPELVDVDDIRWQIRHGLEEEGPAGLDNINGVRSITIITEVLEPATGPDARD